MYSKIISVAGLCLLASCASAQEWTEQAILQLFDQQSPLQREAQAATAAAVEQVRGRTLWPNPAAAYSRETVGFAEFIQGEQLLPLSGRLGWQRQVIEPTRRATESLGAARLWDARSSLRLAFYRALAAELTADAIQAGLGRMDSVIELLRVREREGEGSRYDRSRVEREAAELRADLALARARARSERAGIAAHLPSGTEIAGLRGDIASRTIVLDREALIRKALAERAEIAAESNRMAAADFESRAAGRLRIPEPVVTAGIKRTQTFNNQTDTGAVAGVSVPLPVFNKGQTEVARIAAERARSEARRDLLSQQIAAAVAGAYDVYAARVDGLNAFERETRETSEELLRTARVGYEEGELGILQLLDAYRVERQTAMRRVELQSAVKEIEIELSRNAGFEVTQ